jgi:S1-C subfamily serine protease
MPTTKALNRIKRATVALAMLPQPPPADPKMAPFVIVGSGFCLDARGIIVTCQHVINVFFNRDMHQAIAEIPESDRKGAIWPVKDLRAWRPHALFYDIDSSTRELQVVPVPMEAGVAKTDYDLGVLKVSVHPLFKSGYPYLETEDFRRVFEGMEIATCGFPLGNDLQVKTGAFTSSFTRGILSSITPAPNFDEDMVTGFQLDITATRGNSGGPVFSWDTGKVIGVLQGAPTDESGQAVPGLVRAESIFRLIRDGTLERIHNVRSRLEGLQ